RRDVPDHDPATHAPGSRRPRLAGGGGARLPRGSASPRGRPGLRGLLRERAPGRIGAPGHRPVVAGLQAGRAGWRALWLSSLRPMADQELYGPETRKAVDNFPVSGERVPAAVVHWLGRIKAAAARVNAELGKLDADLAE